MTTVPKKQKSTPPQLSLDDRLAKLEADKKKLLKERRDEIKLKAKEALEEKMSIIASWEKELCALVRELFPDPPSELAETLILHWKRVKRTKVLDHAAPAGDELTDDVKIAATTQGDEQ